MRILSMMFASLLLGGVMAAQAPVATRVQADASKPSQAPGPGAKPDVALFAPDRRSRPLDASFGIFAKVYYGWPVIENAAIAMIEAPDWILKPGRLCSNGRPVPVDRPDFRKFAEDLAVAGRFALKAAQSKSMENMLEAGTLDLPAVRRVLETLIEPEDHRLARLDSLAR